MPKEKASKKKAPQGKGVKRKVIKQLEKLPSCNNLDPSTRQFLIYPLGTGGPINNWKQDNLYVSLIEQYRKEYIFLDETLSGARINKRKKEIAKIIIDHFHGMKGQFVEWKEGEWAVVSDEKRLLEVTQQKLRQDARRHKARIKEEERQADIARMQAEAQQAWEAGNFYAQMCHQRYQQMQRWPLIERHNFFAAHDNPPAANLIANQGPPAAAMPDPPAAAMPAANQEAAASTDSMSNAGTLLGDGDDASAVTQPFNWEQI